MQQLLLFCFLLMTGAVESHWMFYKAHGDYTLPKSQWRVAILITQKMNVADCQNTRRSSSCRQFGRRWYMDPTANSRYIYILNFSRSTISRCLQAIRKPHKSEKWLPHQLNGSKMENRKNTSSYFSKDDPRREILCESKANKIMGWWRTTSKILSAAKCVAEENNAVILFQDNI